MLSYLAHCGGELGGVEDTMLLLVGLAESREKCRGWRRPALPAAVKRGLVKALVLVGAVQEDKVGAVQEDKAPREVYWGQVRGSAVQFNSVQSRCWRRATRRWWRGRNSRQSTWRRRCAAW